MRRPGNNPPRTRRIRWTEVKRICRWLGYDSGPVEAKYQQVALAFLIALRTGARAGEVLQMEMAGNVVRVRHKTQRLTGKPREIPVGRAGRRLLARIPSGGWTINSAALDALFRKCTRSLLIEDLHFHDSRAEALTRLSRQVDVMTLARISGHKDLRVLMETYYRESAADIAARLR